MKYIIIQYDSYCIVQTMVGDNESGPQRNQPKFIFINSSWLFDIIGQE